jgi:hypothetical protein
MKGERNPYGNIRNAQGTLVEKPQEKRQRGIPKSR